VTSGDYGAVFNLKGEPDENVQTIVAQWREEVDEELDLVIGYTKNGFNQRSKELSGLIVESWLVAYPQADIALNNSGGIRADIPKGEITLADVIGVMPFDNTLILLELTGSEFLEVMEPHIGSTIVAGAKYQKGDWYLVYNNEKISPDQTYQVLVNSFMYAGGDDYRFYDYDKDGYDTSTDWRTPVIDWIIEQDSSESVPIDDAAKDLTK
jgi:2',3'-cyclic-nucleotide 2'-phosphodiesterase (5'-nucleotidase family)